jgi:hypothetical protein
LFLLTPLDFLRRYQESGGDVSESALVEAERQVVIVPDDREGAHDPRTGDLTQRLSVPCCRNWTRWLRCRPRSFERRRRTVESSIGPRCIRWGRYSPKRMLRGFTRPVRRISRQLQETGDLDLTAPAMLTPRYDHGVQANAFEIPAEVVKILTADSEHVDRAQVEPARCCGS